MVQLVGESGVRIDWKSSFHSMPRNVNIILKVTEAIRDLGKKKD